MKYTIWQKILKKEKPGKRTIRKGRTALRIPELPEKSVLERGDAAKVCNCHKIRYGTHAFQIRKQADYST
jgi:hypothetical protein